jgi:hypothetical protein
MTPEEQHEYRETRVAEVAIKAEVSPDLARMACEIAHYHEHDSVFILNRLANGSLTMLDFVDAHARAVEERILCAAVYVNDGEDYGEVTYAAPKRGIVFHGLRHMNCYHAMRPWLKTLPKKVRSAKLNLTQKHENQGFLTSKGRYVNREEAWVIAEAARQILPHARHPGTLYSEDLY